MLLGFIEEGLEKIGEWLRGLGCETIVNENWGGSGKIVWKRGRAKEVRC